MKKSLMSFFCGFVFSATVLVGYSSQASAETVLGDYLKEMGVELEVSASIDYYSKYVWRGFVLDNDNVVQPAVTFSLAGFEGGFWGSWDVESSDALASDEVDGWLGYGFDLGFIDEDLSFISFSVGHTWYGFPAGDTGLAEGSQAQEFYFGVAFDTILAPYVTLYYDYGDESSGSADGYYVMAGIGHSITLSEDYGISLDLGYEFGYNDKAFIADDGGYNLFTAGLTVPLTDNVTMTPKVAYSDPYGDIADANDEEFYGGVSFAFSM